MNKQLYRKDLAQVHVDGYGFHWHGAAPTILKWLKEHDIRDGRVVDLGCGGGQWLHQLSESGYETFGIDISQAMIKIAKSHSPTSRFICGSFSDVEIPECQAVTSLGEPINYLEDGQAVRKTIRSVFRALVRGGLFIFDARLAANHKVPPRDHNASSMDWFCHAWIEEDSGSLTRQITTFRKKEKDLFQRSDETHFLKLYSQPKMLQWLRNAGFRVRTRRAYGDYRLGPRQSVFICRKP